MEILIEKMTSMGMEQLAGNTRQELALSDEIILKDLADEKNLEQRYEKLEMPIEQRMVLNDYIACMKTANGRYSDISYMAGIKDTIHILFCMGMLKDTKVFKQ